MIEEIYFDLIKYFGKDVKRINHATKVWSLARLIGLKEGLEDKEQRILEISSILHDISIKVCEEKYNSTAGHYQEIEGPKIAEKILEKYNLEQEEKERILYIIGHHHSYDKIDGLEFQILVEADFLVNIYEENMPQEAIKKIKDRYFKTKLGKDLLETFYYF